jgi:hypothetical protein
MLSLGRTVVGTMIWSAVGAMVQAGLVAGAGGDSDKERALARLTLKPFHYNHSGLERLLRGEDPSLRAGDVQVDYRGLGVMGLAMNIASTGDEDERAIAQASRAPFVRGGVALWERALEVTRALPGAMLDTTMMKGAYSFLTAIKERRYEGIFQQWVETVSGVAMPNTMRAASRVTLDWLPETRAEAEDATRKAEARAFAREVVNRLEMKVHVWREAGRVLRGEAPARRIDDLPLRLDLFGRAVPMTPEGRSAVAYHMIDTLKAERIPMDRYALELRNVYEGSNDPRVIPAEPGRVLTNPVTRRPLRLTDAQHQRYKEIAGTMTRWGMDNLMGVQAWTTMDNGQRAAALATLNERISDAARREFLREIGTGGLRR